MKHLLDNIKRVPYLIISLVLILMMYDMPSLRCVSISNVISLLLLGIVLIKVQGKIFTPFNLLMGCLYLFHSGHLWVSLFYTDLSEFVYEIKYPGDIDNATVVYRDITTYLIVFMSVGILTLKKCPELKLKEYKVTNVAHILVVVTYIVAMATEFMRAGKVASVGYALGFQYTSSFSRILSDFIKFII